MPDVYLNGFYTLTGDAPAESFASFLDVRRLRRAEKIAKNALLCALHACKQGGLEVSAPHGTGLSLAVGAGSLESTCKFMDSILTDGDELSSPTAFAGSVHNATGLTLSLFLQAQGPCMTTGQLDASFAGAFLGGVQFLHANQCSRVLVIAAEDINPVVQSLAPQHPALFTGLIRRPAGPFVRAAAAFLLAKEPSVHTRFCVHHVSFTRVDTQGDTKPVAFSTPAQAALSLAEELSLRRPFTFTDTFGGAQLTLSGEPYAF